MAREMDAPPEGARETGPAATGTGNLESEYQRNATDRTQGRVEAQHLHQASDPLDHVTVLTSKGPLATKRITAAPNGGLPKVESYGRAAHFQLAVNGVSSINDLAMLLAQIEQMPRSFILRGAPKDGVDWQHARRRLRDRHNKDGTVEPATLEPAARHWIALDCDGLACPDWLDPIFEPDQTVEYVVNHLPAEFHDATVVWQFTSSQGIKPGISLRLFFWSDRPLVDWELKHWLRDSPVDHSIFAPAQPIYVARPIFVGMPDPVPYRSGIWRGDREAITPPVIEPKKAAVRGESSTPFAGLAGSGYEFHCRRIGDHEGGNGFFRPVKSAVAAWIARHGAATDISWLRADLERVIRLAARDPAKHDDAYVESRIADLDPLIDAIRELQTAKEAKIGSLLLRCEPTYPPPLTSLEEARAALAAAMDHFAAVALAWSEPLAMAA